MIDYKEKERVYNTNFELVIKDLKDELIKVLSTSTNPEILKLKNDKILKEESFLPVLRQVHSKWRREFEQNKTIIEEVYLYLVTDDGGNYVWKPSMENTSNEQLVFWYNFTQDMTV